MRLQLQFGRPWQWYFQSNLALHNYIVITASDIHGNILLGKLVMQQASTTAFEAAQTLIEVIDASQKTTMRAHLQL